MNQWTDSAQAALEKYFAGLRQSLAGSGADADEVTEDLRRHMQEEVAARGLGVVTEQDVQQILVRIGAPTASAAVAEPPGPAQGPAAPSSGVGHPPPGFLLLFFGVLLPFGAILFEFLTGACAAILFDPLPSLAHMAATTLVPVANLLVWLALRSEAPGRRKAWLGWFNGAAIAIALVYTLFFVPFTPFAVIGVLYVGLGLVPLSPLISLVCAILLRRRLRRAVSGAGPLPGLWRGMAVGFGGLVLVTLPTVITFAGLQMAVSETTAQSNRGIRWLRALGHRGELLRACYGRAGRAGAVYTFGRAVNAEAARAVYYRVTGQPFNSVPPPNLYSGRVRWNLIEDEFTWDNDQAGDAVAGRVRGLSLVGSRQDGTVDPDAALAYLEWTLEFKNSSRLRREARAQIALPPGGVVSRLTLWIDGEEREAAFGGRSQVKSAYKQVVARRRDPVLVTTCGPDRVLVQCFPVPPDGGRMKVRLGITAPLALTRADNGCLRWPCFLERNFTIPEDFQHSLWVQSSRPLEALSGKFKTEESRPGHYTLRGQVRDPDLAAPAGTLRAQRPADLTAAWTWDKRAEDKAVIRQVISSRPVTVPDRVVLVVDATRGIEDFTRRIGAALSRLPDGIDFAVLVARDGCEEFIPLEKGAANLYRRVALWKIRGEGGHDNVPALVQAWELAAQAKAGAIVWVHQPQPMQLDSTEELRQRFERSQHPPRLFDIQTQPGPNRVSEALDGLRSVESILRLGDLGDDLGRLFASWNGQAATLEPVWDRLPVTDSSPAPAGKETSLHLARLWARAEVVRLCDRRQLAEAAELARKYQLVTTVSGAVVLESQAQYQQAGLEPVSPETVPVVPEPSAAALLLLGGVSLALVRHRRLRSRLLGLPG